MTRRRAFACCSSKFSSRSASRSSAMRLRCTTRVGSIDCLRARSTPSRLGTFSAAPERAIFVRRNATRRRVGRRVSRRVRARSGAQRRILQRRRLAQPSQPNARPTHFAPICTPRSSVLRRRKSDMAAIKRSLAGCRRANISSSSTQKRRVDHHQLLLSSHTKRLQVAPDRSASNEVFIDSDDCDSDASDEDNVYDIGARPHRDPNSFAWILLRAACVAKQIANLKRFLVVAGFKPSGLSKSLFKTAKTLINSFQDLVGVSAHIDSVLKLLNGWFLQLQNSLDAYADGCPISFLPSMYVTADESALNEANKTANISPLLRKYYSLVERNNSPFEYASNGVLPVKRLWAYLVRQDSIQHFFIHHIFARDSTTTVRSLACARSPPSSWSLQPTREFFVCRTQKRISEAQPQNPRQATQRTSRLPRQCALCSVSAKASSRLRATIRATAGSFCRRIVKCKRST